MFRLRPPLEVPQRPRSGQARQRTPKVAEPAGQVAVRLVVVDDEVVPVEAAGHGGAQGHGLDGLVVSSLTEAGSGVARSVGGVRQHREARLLSCDSSSPVTASEALAGVSVDAVMMPVVGSTVMWAL